MAGPGPRILVTGFSSFPGVPANPTEALIGALALRPEALAPFGEVRLEVLPVEYRAVPSRLAALGSAFAPDIAVHFGVSAQAEAFAVEMLARNAVCVAKPDNSGFVPLEPFVRQEAEPLGSSLPVEAILAALRHAGLSAEVSDDAGDYLCNFLFYLSRGAHCPPFAPAMAGFVHVPPFGTTPADGRAFDLAMLTDGAMTILAACAEAWHAAQHSTQAFSPAELKARRRVAPAGF